MEINEESLQRLISGAVEAAIKSAKAPTEIELAKLAKEKAVEEQRTKEMLATAKAEEESRLAAWRNCDHKKPDGRPSVGGQVHSDGLVHIICLRCQFPFPPVKPTQDMVATGI